MKIDNFGPTSKIAQKVANFWATFLKKSSPRSLKSRQNGDKSLNLVQILLLGVTTFAIYLFPPKYPQEYRSLYAVRKTKNRYLKL